MEFMAKKLLAFVSFFILFSSFSAFCAEISSELTDKTFKVFIKFDKGYSDVNVINLDKSYIVSFQTAENTVYSEEFWDSSVSQAYVHSEGDRKKLIIDFIDQTTEPNIEASEKSVTVTFALPENRAAPAVVGTGTYIRMVSGLGFVIVLILVVYWFTRKLLARRVLSELPGTGRLLGKVDLEIRKSLYFYELGENVYIFGVTDMSVNLIEKITDVTEVNKIKSGFSRKGDFGSYLNFFNKGSDVKHDLDASRNIIREKLKSIKKR